MPDCREHDCQGLHDMKADLKEFRADYKRDYSRHQTVIAAIVSIGLGFFGAMTQWQIAKLNKTPATQVVGR